jgi:predicted HNH restriction endonuclease
MTPYDEAYLERTMKRALESAEHYRLPRGIIRYDYAHTHGWWVRVTRDKATFRKMFFDTQSGSIENALRRAIQYRHELLSSFPVTITRTHPRSLSPDPEKRIYLKTEKGKQQPYVFWQAKWHDEQHRIKAKNFSVLKYGQDGAKAMALKTTTANHNRLPKLSAVPDVYQEERWREVRRSDVDILASINSDPYRSNEGLQTAVEASDPFGYEGARNLVLHVSIERDKKLRATKIVEFLREFGRLHCELCMFNFLQRYPFLIADIIEVHHVVPLAKLSLATKVSTSDLMLLCSNCHTAVHQGDAEENLVAAMMHFEGRQDA